MYDVDCLGGEWARGWRGKKGYWGVKRMEVHHIYTYEYSIMKPTKHVWMRGEKEREEEWDYNAGGKFAYCMELSYWNSANSTNVW
jgi:hypothetical protein